MAYVSHGHVQEALLALHKASSGGAAALRSCLKEKPSVLDVIDNQGRNLLDIALSIGIRREGLSELLKAKKSLCKGHGTRGDLRRPAFCRILDKQYLDAEDIETLCMLLQADTDVAHEFDEGVLPLHKLLDRPPESFFPQMEKLMEQLLLVYNHAAYVPIGGVLPLHMALHRGVSVEGIQTLLRSNPEAGGHRHPGGHYPLFIALQQRLSLLVVTTLIEYFPAALCETIKGLDLTPLEYAAKMRFESSVVKALVIGGTGKVAKCSAYAMAALDGMAKRTSFTKIRGQLEVEEEWQEAMMNDSGNLVALDKAAGDGLYHCYQATLDTVQCDPEFGQCGSCKRYQDGFLTLQIKPYHGQCFTVSLPKNLLVEDLFEMVARMEGTKVGRQKLIDSSGHRLRPGDEIQHAVKQIGDYPPHSAALAVQRRTFKVKAKTNKDAKFPRGVPGDPMSASYGDEAFIERRPTIFLVPKMDILIICVRAGCTVDVINRILYARPALAEEQDEDGALPLHLALQADIMDEDVILALHKIYPGACRVRAGPESHHQYPIETAIYNGCSTNVLEAFVHMVEDDDWTERGYFDPHNKDEGVKFSHAPLMFEAIKTGVNKSIFELLVEKEYPLDQIDPTTDLTLLEMSVTENSEEALFNYLFETITSRVGQDELKKGPKGGTLLHTACLTQTPDYIISEICDASRLSGLGLITRENMDGELALHCGCATRLPRDSGREVLLRYLNNSVETEENWVRGSDHRKHEHLMRQGYCTDRPPATLAEWPTARTGLLPIQIAVQSNAVEGFVFELARIAPRTLAVIDARGNNLLDLAAKADAATHIVYELLEIYPDLIKNVKVFDSRFPNNPCAAEIRRLALTPPRPIAPFRAIEQSESYSPDVEDVAHAQPKMKRRLAAKAKPKAAEPEQGGFFSWLWY